jgi:CubicO group peptidase (beta-lactamase class C family)
MTKPLTSLTLLMLMEQGKVGLDDEARRWVPWLKSPHVLQDVDLAAGTFSTRPPQTAITVRHLLTHTSGIGYSWSDPALALAEKRDSRQTFLLADPGTRWIYGAGTRALGDIVVSETGERFDRALKRLLLDRIGARETAFFVPPTKLDRVATVHRRTGERLIEEPNPSHISGRVNADGDLFSTASDYGRFLQLILREGEIDGARIVSQETVRLMAKPQIGQLRVEEQGGAGANQEMSRPYPVSAGIDTWGLGFQIDETGSAGQTGPYRRSKGSLSWGGLFNTHFWIDPARGIGAVLLMQVLPFYDDEAMATLQGFEERIYRNLN